MAYLGITATAAGMKTARGTQPLESVLCHHLARLEADAPVVVLIHGFRYDPARPGNDPHRGLFSTDPGRGNTRIRSWPGGLGFSGDRDGLCIGFGWPACTASPGTIAVRGRTSFAAVYDAAPEYGRMLARLIRFIQESAPGRPVDILAHSLGARVALSSLPHLNRAPGRMVLLGAAEFEVNARAFLAALPGTDRPEIYNVTGRFNDIYDALFEVAAPRRGVRGRSLGCGLRGEEPGWLDIQIDRQAVTAWFQFQGLKLQQAPRLCHWSFYTRDGTLAVYQAILRRRPGWDVETLRRQACFRGQDRRWSRLLPAIGLPWTRPAEDPGLAESLENA